MLPVGDEKPLCAGASAADKCGRARCQRGSQIGTAFCQNDLLIWAFSAFIQKSTYAIIWI
jgi:hypothetical protein